MLDSHLKRFSRLRTYKDRRKWSALTAHQAPHKPFLRMSVMDLFAQRKIERIRFRIQSENGTAVAIRDRYPVTEMHTLVLPRREPAAHRRRGAGDQE